MQQEKAVIVDTDSCNYDFSQHPELSKCKDDVNYYSPECNKLLLKKEVVERNCINETSDATPYLYPNLNDANFNVKIADGYKDLHTVVMDFFNPKKNDMALAYLLLYVVSMAVLAFHLWHGFASGFQSLGLNHKRYTPLIHGAGKLFALAVPGLFALITILIYLK